MNESPRTPKKCSRCKGTGQVSFTYAGGFCMACGGDGIKKAQSVKVAVATIEGPFGGPDGHVAIFHRAADHRDATWTVTVYSSRLTDADSSENFSTEAAARTAANAAFRTLKARTADYYTARTAARTAAKEA